MGGGSKVKSLGKINHAAFKKTLDAVAHAKNMKIMTICSAYDTRKRCVDSSRWTAGLSYQDGFDFTHGFFVRAPCVSYTCAMF